MRAFVLAPLIALATPAFAGEPILVPDFTPGTTSEFGLAFMLHERVVEALHDDGHVVLTGDAVSPLVGPLVACADEAGCPYDALQQLPARWALVVRIERRDGNLTAIVQLYEKSGASPIDKATLIVTPGKEQDFGAAVVGMLDGAVTDLGPTPSSELAKARALLSAPTPVGTPPDRVAGDPIPPHATHSPPEDLDAKTPPGPKAPASATLTVPEKLDKAGLKPRHIVGCKGSFGEWDGPPLEWLYKNAPHAGRFTVEVRGGLAIGDVDRHADVLLALDNDLAIQTAWFQEGPVSQKRPRGALYLGYAPTTWLDLGTVLGLQYGHRTLTTGFTVDGSPGNSADSEVQAVQVWFQPIARFYFVPMGPIKPYVFVGADIRAFDHYKIAPSGNLTFPEPPAGVVPGPNGGAGLLVDPGPIVGFFAEGSYTQHLGVRAVAAESGTRPPDAPSPPGYTGHTIAITGGVQFRL